MNGIQDQRLLNATAARGMVVLGSAGLLLLGGARMGELPYDWSFLILKHAAVWGLISAAILCGGIAFYWNTMHPETSWRPSLPGRRFESVVLYTRAACPLCDDAGALLSQYRMWIPSPVEVDVDDDPELVQQFGEWVPVVEFDGRIRFRGQVSEVLLQRLIEGTPARSA